MPNYLGNPTLWKLIDQILTGVTPGGVDALLDLFKRHHVRPDEVVQALEAAGRGNASTVAEFVVQHPQLAEWYGDHGGMYDRAALHSALVAMRERCALLCEARAKEEVGDAYAGIALDCAAAIRGVALP